MVIYVSIKWATYISSIRGIVKYKINQNKKNILQIKLWLNPFLSLQIFILAMI